MCISWLLLTMLLSMNGSTMKPIPNHFKKPANFRALFVYIPSLCSCKTIVYQFRVAARNFTYVVVSAVHSVPL